MFAWQNHCRVLGRIEMHVIVWATRPSSTWRDNSSCSNRHGTGRSTHAHTPPVGCVLADAEFDSERNHTFVRQQLHALSIIPLNAGQRRGPFMASELKCDRFPQAKILSSCVD